MPEPPSLEPTIAHIPAALARSGGQDHGESARVRLTEGSRPSLSAEIAAILRSRLQVSAFILAVGLALFLARALSLDRPTVVWLRVLVFLLAIACFWQLKTRQTISLGRLRLIELVLLFLLGLQTVVLQVAGMHAASQRLDAVETTGTMIFAFMTWIVVILGYGVFIPNTSKRAALIVIPAAAMPLATTMALCAANRAVADVTDWNWLVASSLMTVVAAIAAVFGSSTVSTLRAAFRAKKFGQYRLRQRLGGGGMGEVYLADHQLLKRPSAIKLIRPGYDTDVDALARFELEVQATAKLSHWNTVDIFDFGRTDDGTFYYVMEYLPGMSLYQLVQRHGPMPAARVVHFLSQTCGALREAHAAGLIHRDIKPANIFAAERGGVYDIAKLLDFGLVQQIERGAESSSDEPVSNGRVAGSPLFMAPEQALGVSVADVRSDIYSLGATAYCLLTGQPPFVGDNAARILRAHVEETVTRPSKLRPDVPADLETVVLRCLEKEPLNRFSDACQLEEALAACACFGQWTEELAADWWRRFESGEPPGGDQRD